MAPEASVTIVCHSQFDISQPIFIVFFHYFVFKYGCEVYLPKQILHIFVIFHLIFNFFMKYQTYFLVCMSFYFKTNLSDIKGVKWVIA